MKGTGLVSPESGEAEAVGGEADIAETQGRKTEEQQQQLKAGGATAPHPPTAGGVTTIIVLAQNRTSKLRLASTKGILADARSQTADGRCNQATLH